MWNMFKVNNNNTRTYFSSVSIVDFEKVNVSWVESYQVPLFRKINFSVFYVN